MNRKEALALIDKIYQAQDIKNEFESDEGFDCGYDSAIDDVVTIIMSCCEIEEEV